MNRGKRNQFIDISIKIRYLFLRKNMKLLSLKIQYIFPQFSNSKEQLMLKIMIQVMNKIMIMKDHQLNYMKNFNRIIKNKDRSNIIRERAFLCPRTVLSAKCPRKKCRYLPDAHFF